MFSLSSFSLTLCTKNPCITLLKKLKKCTKENIKMSENPLFSPELGEISKALSQAQKEFHEAVKDSKNPFYKSTYANLESCIEASRPALTKHNLAVTHALSENEKGDFILITTISHSSGQFIRSKLRLLIDKNDMQKLGAAITYARRFAYAALIGLSQTDDDGESLMERNEPQPKIGLTQKKQEIEIKPSLTEDLKKIMAQNGWTSGLIKEHKAQLPSASKQWNDMNETEQKEFMKFIENVHPSML